MLYKSSYIIALKLENLTLQFIIVYLRLFNVQIYA